MTEGRQLSLLGSCETRRRVAGYIKDMLAKARQPSARELVAELDRAIGIVARWDLEGVLASLVGDDDLTRAQQEYLSWLLEGEDLLAALRGKGAPDREAVSTIDSLLQASRNYRQSTDFQEMIGFMGRFRDYAPYNNMLVRIQNPACSFYATASDWQKRFGRMLIEDARPMLILAPMHPVMLATISTRPKAPNCRPNCKNSRTSRASGSPIGFTVSSKTLTDTGFGWTSNRFRPRCPVSPRRQMDRAAR